MLFKITNIIYSREENVESVHSTHSYIIDKSYYTLENSVGVIFTLEKQKFTELQNSQHPHTETNSQLPSFSYCKYKSHYSILRKMPKIYAQQLEMLEKYFNKSIAYQDIPEKDRIHIFDYHNYMNGDIYEQKSFYINEADYTQLFSQLENNKNLKKGWSVNVDLSEHLEEILGTFSEQHLNHINYNALSRMHNKIENSELAITKLLKKLISQYNFQEYKLPTTS